MAFKGDAAASVDNSNEDVVILSTDSEVEDVINVRYLKVKYNYSTNIKKYYTICIIEYLHGA